MWRNVRLLAEPRTDGRLAARAPVRFVRFIKNLMFEKKCLTFLIVKVILKVLQVDEGTLESF